VKRVECEELAPACLTVLQSAGKLLHLTRTYFTQRMMVAGAANRSGRSAMFIASRATRVEQLRRSDMSSWSVQQHGVQIPRSCRSYVASWSPRYSLLQTWRSYRSLISHTRAQMRANACKVQAKPDALHTRRDWGNSGNAPACEIGQIAPRSVWCAPYSGAVGFRLCF